MNLDAQALIQTSGINCVEVLRSSLGEHKRKASFAYVSEKSIEALRGYMRRPEYKSSNALVDAFYGGAVVYTPEAEERYRFIAPGQHSSFFFNLNNELLPLTGPGMIDIREKIISHVSSGGTLDTSAERALVGIQDIFHMVQSAPDSERFPDSLIASAYRARLIEAFGPIEDQIEDDVIRRICMGNLLKARVSMCDPSHPEGFGFAPEMRDIFLAMDIGFNPSGISRRLDADRFATIDEYVMRNGIKGNANLSRVFMSLTLSPIDKLSAAMISSEELDEMRFKAQGMKLSGAWVQHLPEMLSKNRSTNAPKTKIDMFSITGRDILIVQDQACVKNGIAFAYSWKTKDRYPVLLDGEKKFIALSEEEAPSDEHIDELKMTLKTLIAERKAPSQSSQPG